MRIVTSQDFPDGLADIRRHWSFADLFQAHLVLDYLDAKRERAMKREEP